MQSWKVWAAAAIGCMAAACTAGAQPAGGGEVIPSAGLREDAAILRRAYEALHPGLYRYRTSEQVDALFTGLDVQFEKDRTLGEAFLNFSKALADIRCGHSYLNPYNQNKAVVSALFEHRRYVPFCFRWIEGRMIVTANRSTDERLRPGVEIVEIDATPAKTILDVLMPLARADGNNDAKRIALLEVRGEDEYEAFDVFWPLVFGSTSDSMDLVIREPGRNETLSVRVPGLTRAQRLEPMKQRIARRTSGEPLWTVDSSDPRCTILRMPTWALFNTPWDWKAWLKARMDEIVAAGTPNLVIDLRGNEGGLDCGWDALSRLVSEDLKLDRLQRFVRYRKTPDSLNQYLDTWDDSFRDWGDDAVESRAPALVGGVGVPYYVLKESDEAAVVHPVGPRFAGRVFVLIDAACSSATFQFALAVKSARVAKLVGRTTGGSLRGINGGAFFFLRLPNSKLEIDVPLIARFPEGLPPDTGVEPDVRVEPSAAEIASGADVDMAAVRSIILREDAQKAK